MNSDELARLIAQLGVTGVDPSKLSAALTLVEALGGQVQVSRDELDAYYPDVDTKSFYLPTNVPKNFYFDADGLKRLSTVNSGVFRRLLGIK